MIPPALLLTGLSGVGKTTLGSLIVQYLRDCGTAAVLLDGDQCRATLCADLGFSRVDRLKSNTRMAMLAHLLQAEGIVPVVSAILPYERGRQDFCYVAPLVLPKVIYLTAPLSELEQRDPKGLYRRARLPEDHPEHLPGLTGVTDVYEPPPNPWHTLDTSHLSPQECLYEIGVFLEETYV